MLVRPARGAAPPRGTLLLVAVVTSLAAGVAGCGGNDDAPTPPPRTDAAVVSRNFETATGAALKVSTGGNAPELRLADAIAGSRRFPRFSLELPQTSEARDRLLENDRGERLVRDKDGFYGETATSFVKDYGRGVFLRADATEIADPRFAELDRVMAAVAAGTPERAPDTARPCAAVGIDPVRGKEGSCAEEGRRLTVVDAGTRLRAGRLSAKLVGVAQTSEIPSRGPGYGTYRTKGRVVVVVYRLTNSGGEPIDVPFEPQLVVGGERFGDDDSESAPSIFLDAYRPRAFPLRDGKTVKLGAAFRVPRRVAARVAREGQLELPAEAGTLAAGAPGDVGRIRLAGAKKVGIDDGQVATK
ncbi:hypothetical protein [Patulibacter minatonensis]|uniref:hypothetical protein n=1 Tax=Patulibacter minatonensis TaxID=298163 RepID=UPI00047A2B61|nr:hypothetical protein [Patulibacter minatonensis]